MSESALIEVLTSPVQAKIDAYEKLVSEMPQYDLQTKHCPYAGMYGRSVYIAAGVTFVGSCWEKDHICVVVGDVTVTTDEGTKRITGFNMFEAKAGVRRVGYAHCDTYWVTIVRTDKTDITEIEDECTKNGPNLQSRLLKLGHTEVKKIQGE
jgi:hypothetical protein